MAGHNLFRPLLLRQALTEVDRKSIYPFFLAGGGGDTSPQNKMGEFGAYVWPELGGPQPSKYNSPPTSMTTIISAHTYPLIKKLTVRICIVAVG